MIFFGLQLALLLILKLIEETNCTEKSFNIIIRPMTSFIMPDRSETFINIQTDSTPYGIHLYCKSKNRNTSGSNSQHFGGISKIFDIDGNQQHLFTMPGACKAKGPVYFYISITINADVPIIGENEHSDGENEHSDGENEHSDGENEHSDGSEHSSGFEFLYGLDYTTWPSGRFYVSTRTQIPTIILNYYKFTNTKHIARVPASGSDDEN